MYFGTSPCRLFRRVKAVCLSVYSVIIQFKACYYNNNYSKLLLLFSKAITGDIFNAGNLYLQRFVPLIQHSSMQ